MNLGPRFASLAHRRIRGLARGLPLLLLSCTSLDPAPGSSTSKCVEVVRPLASLDDPTPWGVTPRSILEFSLGPRTDPMHWTSLAPDGEFTFTMAPESGITQITTELVHLGAAPRWIHSEPEIVTLPELDALDCPDRLEIDVELRADSAQGALRERVPTTLVATGPEAARVRYVQGDDAIRGGALAFASTTPPGVLLAKSVLNLSYTPAGHFGELLAVAQYGDLDAIAELAHWPAPPPSLESRLVRRCLRRADQFYLAYDEAPIAGFSATGLQTLIAQQNPLYVTPKVGMTGPGQISFDPTGDRSCAVGIHEAKEPQNRWQFGTPGLLGLTVGGHRTQLPVLAVSYTNGQALHNVELRSDWRSSRPTEGALTKEAFTAAYGNFGIKLGAYPFYAINAIVNYQSQEPGSIDPDLTGGVQILGIRPNPRVRGGAVVEELARWEFRG